ncbi:hypothetical protein EMPG_12880 [Blastomyces silverae]|uniref:Uncharacterized protein n=1 Tax=Blastomyces silverae TaxID=2060906 RepID=A0A0H1BL04_9EURO|nr:hypothetical protein EMPG_12880 [Blastomyces silverae]
MLLCCRQSCVEFISTSAPPGSCHCRHVARNGLLSHPILPALPHRKTDRPVLHRSAGICRSCRSRLCRLPGNGRLEGPCRIPVDVSSIRHRRYSHRNQSSLVASRTAPTPRTKIASKTTVSKMDPSNASGT